MKINTRIRNVLAIFTLGAASFAAPSYAVQASSESGTGQLVPFDDGSDSGVSGDFTSGPTRPGKWGPGGLGTGATVTWSLVPSGTSCASEFIGCKSTALSAFMPAGFITEINAAFAAWSSVANLHFVQVADNGVSTGGAGTSADIRLFGQKIDGPRGVLAFGYYPPSNGQSNAGDIHFDIDELWKTTFGGPGFNLFNVAAHELGHALGLDHTDVPNSLMNPIYSEAFKGPQADDIDGMQFLYGKAAAVPIPATSLLIMAGFLGMASMRRRV
jgi:hypothetical protein